MADEEIDGAVSAESRQRMPSRRDRGDIVAEKIVALKKSRSGHVSNLTKLMKQFEHKCSTLNSDELDKLLYNVTAAYEECINLNHKLLEVSVTANATDEAKQASEFEARLKSDMNVFDTQAAEWKLAQTTCTQQDGMRLGESANSITSSGSSRSKLIKAKAEQAKKELELRQLKIKQDLERRENELKQQSRILEVELELEAAKITSKMEEDILGEEELNACVNVVHEPTTRPKERARVSTADSQQNAVDVHQSTPIQNQQSPINTSPFRGIQNPLNPFSPEWHPPVKSVQHDIDMRNHQPKGKDNSLNSYISHEEATNAYSSMAAAVKEAFTMPKPEIMKFSGNPMDYFKFMSCFDTNIANRTTDDEMKLSYLIQFCEGEAKEHISDYVIQTPSEGYENARRALKSRYGRPHTIAQAYMKQLVNGHPIKQDAKALTSLAMLMTRCNLTLQEMGYAADLNNSSNLLKIVRRFPVHMRAKWAEKAHTLIEKEREPTFSDLAKFVERSAQVANTMYGLDLCNQQDHTSKSYQRPQPDRKMATFATTGETSKSTTKEDSSVPTFVTTNESFKDQDPKCLKCEKRHSLAECSIFKAMKVEDRKKFTREKGLCDNCFKRGHRSVRCFKDKVCTLENCSVPWKHHTLLHPSSSERTSKQANVTTCSTKTGNSVFLRIVPVRVQASPGGPCIETYALLDDCSDVSLCDERLCKALDLRGKKRTFRLTTVNKEESETTGLEVKLNVTSLDGNEIIQMNRVLAIKRLPISRQSIAAQDDIDMWPHLKDVILPKINNEASDVMLLIGSDCPEVFWSLEERRGGRKDPYAVKSLLGWTVIGPVNGQERESFSVNFVGSQDLSQQMRQFFEYEFNDVPSLKNGPSVEDQKALHQMETTVTKDGDHYQLPLPWRSRPPDLLNNRPLAEGRLHLLGKRFNRNEDLKKQYCEVVEGYIKKGYAKKVDEAEMCDAETPVWYIPHHGVFHPKKPGKLRVVFDCAAGFKGKSLNDELMQGPDLTNSLVGVLHRFRQERVAIAADVEAMFHQVRVTPSDRSALRFLWWEDEKPVAYQMCVHLFGATSSPSCCCFALSKAAKDNRQFGEEAVRTVLKNFYVDDCLKSVATTEEAMSLMQNLTELLKSGGFHLTKWVSSERKIIQGIPENERAKSVVDLDLEELPTERTLGVLWDVQSDCFVFKALKGEKPATRRGILSIVSSLYDPLGFVAPVILSAKQILQALCREELDWDENISQEKQQCWQRWLDDLEYLPRLKIERCFFPKGFGSIKERELHCFGDASDSGYGAVVYLRQVDDENNICTSFVMGKSRLAPLKSVTIPRLELSAAVVAVHLMALAREELEIRIDNVTMWTDSTTVLQYIRNEKRRYKTFVANRLSVIHEFTNQTQWKHVRSQENPADIASRGLMASDEAGLQSWLNGPTFLSRSKESWPEQIVLGEVEEEALELKKEFNVNVAKVDLASPTDSLLMYFSSWTKLQRAVAWILRFKQFCMKKFLKSDCLVATEELTVMDIQAAAKEILCHEQEVAFHEEMDALRRGSTVPSKSPLVKLHPILESNLLRVGGRIQRSSLPYDSKHPIILPKKSHVTRLIIDHEHKVSGHSGADHVLTSVRKAFWVIDGRTTVKGVLSRCFSCKKRNAPRCEQVMAPLPAERLTAYCRPFFHTGIDYFGPLTVKRARSHEKRYGCVFTCMSSRAIHIEVAHSLDTDSFLGALQRFICRRGTPRKIFSDNGTNFTAGDRELREQIRQLDENKIKKALLQDKIEWCFNPPAASHMGGVWERMVRSIKSILRALLKEQVVNDEALLTIMAEVERILNDRPLTTPSSDCRDDTPLTPNKILLLERNSCAPPGVFNSQEKYTRRWFRQAQYIANVFWRRWLAEYLPTLQARQKWNKIRRNLDIDDLVLVADERFPRGQWPIGRVIETHKDSAGFVRSVKVRVQGTEKVRPIAKLCFLEASVDELQCEMVESEAREHKDRENEIDSRSSTDRPRRAIKTPKWHKDYV